LGGSSACTACAKPSEQFNFVVSTNTAGVELWKHLGFAIVGTLPKVFRHRTLGDVDAYVMYRSLDTVEGVPDER
jgi:hypothetical protein